MLRDFKIHSYLDIFPFLRLDFVVLLVYYRNHKSHILLMALVECKIKFM